MHILLAVRFISGYRFLAFSVKHLTNTRYETRVNDANTLLSPQTSLHDVDSFSVNNITLKDDSVPRVMILILYSLGGSSH